MLFSFPRLLVLLRVKNKLENPLTVLEDGNKIRNLARMAYIVSNIMACIWKQNLAEPIWMAYLITNGEGY